MNILVMIIGVQLAMNSNLMIFSLVPRTLNDKLLHIALLSIVDHGTTNRERAVATFHELKPRVKPAVAYASNEVNELRP